MNYINIRWRILLVVALAMTVIACDHSGSTAAHNNSEPAASGADYDAAGATSTPDQHANHPEDNAARIEAADAIKLSRSGKAIIIDVRGTDAYNISHIKGALDINLGKLESGDYQGLRNDKRVIPYCT